MSSSKKRKSNKYLDKKLSFPKSETIEKKINKQPIDLGAGSIVKPALKGKATVKGGIVTASVKKTTGIEGKESNIGKTVTASVKKTEDSRKTTAGVKKTASGIDKIAKKIDKTLKGPRKEAVEVREVAKESNYPAPGTDNAAAGHGKKTFP